MARRGLASKPDYMPTKPVATATALRFRRRPKPWRTISARRGTNTGLAANVLELTSEQYDQVVFDNENKATKIPGYRVDALTDALTYAAIRYIDAQQSKPCYLFISFLEPQHQKHTNDYPAPDGCREHYTGNEFLRTWPRSAAPGSSTSPDIMDRSSAPTWPLAD